ncbi:MAG: EAL domain-containing protein [Cyanobacteria bacterium P01_D01_bin.14]
MTQILLVDDEPQIRASLSELLELSGFFVKTAADGQAGVAQAQADLPDIVICDIHMPELDGYGVLSALRKQPQTALIPVIFLTAKGDHASVRQGMNLGVDDYLVKPVEPEELVAAIDTQIEKRTQLSQHYQLAQHHCPTDEVDALTGLSNLLGLETQFQQTTAANPAIQYSLTLVKLNNYTQLRERLGHVFGLRVLETLSERLRQTRADSVETIAYIGSERFIVFAIAAGGQASALQTERSLKQGLQTPINIHNHEIKPDLSWRTLCLQSGDDFNQSLLKVMRSPSHHRSPSTSAPGSKASWETRLEQALTKDEFSLYFQPQVDLKTGQILGAEVLLRWQSPTGPISPAVFIPIAEENGLIVPIVDWVMQAACNQLRKWQTEAMFAMTLSINLSAQQLQRPNFQQRLLDIVEEHCISPALIDLELTERVLVSYTGTESHLLQALRAQGFSIAIDDFGTGYSSLGYLQQLPIDLIKIDQCFVRDLDKNLGNRVIVKAITDMAHGLNIGTLAEGVESPEELAVLRQLNCEAMQGYLYSEPLSASEFEKLIVKEKEKQALLTV